MFDFKGKGPSEDCHKDCHKTANLTGKAKNVRVYPNRVGCYITKNYMKTGNYTNLGLLRGPARGQGGPQNGASVFKKGTLFHNVE